MTHTELDIDYSGEELRIKFYILVEPAGVCVYVRDRLEGKKKRERERRRDKRGRRRMGVKCAQGVGRGEGVVLQ